MKNESEWKTWYVKQLRDRGHYARRVEDAFGVGFPDMIVKTKTLAPAFIEVKIVSGRYFAPSPRQYVELMMLNQPPLSYGVVIGVKDEGYWFLSRKEGRHSTSLFPSSSSGGAGNFPFKHQE